jgi:hypothetical protein
MLSAAAQAYQAKEVANIVEQANDPLQKILQGELRDIVARDFVRDLDIEKTSIDGYYNNVLRKGSPSPAAIEALTEWKEVRLEQNAERVRAVTAYLVVLDKVARGHQELYDNRNKLDAQALTKDLFSLVTELRKQITILAKS